MTVNPNVNSFTTSRGGVIAFRTIVAIRREPKTSKPDKLKTLVEFEHKTVTFQLEDDEHQMLINAYSIWSTGL